MWFDGLGLEAKYVKMGLPEVVVRHALKKNGDANDCVADLW